MKLILEIMLQVAALVVLWTAFKYVLGHARDILDCVELGVTAAIHGIKKGFLRYLRKEAGETGEDEEKEDPVE